MGRCVGSLEFSNINHRGKMGPFPWAAQPEVVLSVHKDAHYRREMRNKVTQAAESVLGPHVSVAVQPELKFCAESFYFMLTTLRGRQTPGEEYCDIFQVASDGMLGKFSNRVILFILAIGAPYISKRIETGGWGPLISIFQRPQTAIERAASIRRRMMERIPARKETVSYLPLMKRWATFFLGWTNFLFRVQLASFYLKGDYYDWAKRLTGTRYVSSREPRTQRPSYRILGWFLLAQLLAESWGSVQTVGRSIGKSWGLIVDTKVAVPIEDDSTATVSRGLEKVKCGICLSPVENGACPPCGHMYCYKHIVEAVVVKNECPLCRQSCSPNEIVCVYFTL